MYQLLGGYSPPRVPDFQLQPVPSCRRRNADTSPLRRVFHRIGHEVEDHFLQECGIGVPRQLRRYLQQQFDAVALRSVGERAYLHAEHRGDIDAMDMDAAESLLLDFPEIQYLLNQVVQAFDILVHHIRILVQLRILRAQLCDTLVHAVDKRQRRTEFMRNVDEEIEPRLIELLALFLLQPGYDTLLLPAVMPAQQGGKQPYEPCREQDIAHEGCRRAVPRRQHRQGQRVDLRGTIHDVALVAHVQQVTARGNIHKGDAVVFL